MKTLRHVSNCRCLPGVRTCKTWFETEDGNELGAYYVYVEWLGL